MRSRARRWQPVSPLFLLALGVSGLGGCRQILDLHDRSEKAGDNGASGYEDSGSADGTADVSAQPEAEVSAETGEAEASADVEVDAAGSEAAADAEASARTEAGAGSAASTCAALTYASGACAECMDAQCCAQAVACASDSDCKAAADCYLACGDSDSSCRGRCNHVYHRPDALNALLTCRATSCNQACGVTCGSLAYSATACESCVQRSCCATEMTCAKNEACQSEDACNDLNCLAGIDSCPQACAAAYPTGAADYQAWYNCVHTTCASDCAGGASWECLDAPVPFPTPQSADPITVSLAIVDVITGAPFVGTTVKACSKSQLDCATALASGTTDDDGRVSLTLSPVPSGYDGYLELTGGVRTSDGSAIYNSLWYVVPAYVTGGFKGSFQFIAANDFASFGDLLGVTLDSTLGALAVDAVDCDYAVAQGITFSTDADADAGATTYYFLDNLPSVARTSTDNRSGIGGLVNVPPGLRLLTARRLSDQRSIGQLYMQVRAGWLTSSTFPPIPTL